MKKIDWEKGGGLVPAIVQDSDSGEVLMLGYMNQEALKRTFDEGRVWFFSRSKGRLWMKGETSGNELEIISVKVDCDGDALLVGVRPKGQTCHTGRRSCFDDNQICQERTFGKLAPGPMRAASVFSDKQELIERDFSEKDDQILKDLFQLICKRKKEMPRGSYTTALFREGLEKICAKVEEEAEEVCRAARSEGRKRVIEESVDVLYHLLVLLAESGVSWEEVLAEVRRRGKGDKLDFPIW